MELEALSAIQDQFAAAGATLVIVSPQTADHNAAIAKQKKLTVDILSDPGNGVATWYGLTHTLPDDLKAIYQQFGIDLPAHNGDEGWALPMPATFIIDGGGVIRRADISPDYTIRPEPEDTLAALKSLLS